MNKCEHENMDTVVNGKPLLIKVCYDCNRYFLCFSIDGNTIIQRISSSIIKKILESIHVD